MKNLPIFSFHSNFAHRFRSAGALLCLSTLLITSAHADSSNQGITDASSSELKLYRQGVSGTSNRPVAYNELGDVIGGEIYVGLHINLGINDRVTSTTARIRLLELPDTANGVEHTANENHVDVVVKLDNVEGWQEFYDPDGSGPQLLGWWSARRAPVATQTANSQSQYRYLFKWDTSQLREGERFDLDHNQSGKLWGHNGQHQISVSSVDDVVGTPIAFQSDVMSRPAKTVTVSNLAITDVSTSNGTTDYFKFSNGEPEGSALKSPTVSFKIKDDGDPHFYTWKVRIRSTDSEKWDGVVIQGVSNPNETITAYVNNFIAPEQTQVGDVLSGAEGEYKPIKQWGTYAFEIEVDEVDVFGNKLGDYQNLRSKLFLPYYMPVRDEKGQFLRGHGGDSVRGNDGVNRYSVSYYIKDEGTLTPTQPELSALQIQTLPPNLGTPMAVAPESWGKKVNTAYTNQLLHTYPIPLETGIFITTFIGTDNYKAFYRDHRNRQTLTKNERIVINSNAGKK